MIIKIENLRVRTIVGIFEWEKEVKQDIVINIDITFDATKAIEKDSIDETIDYKSLNKKIITLIENKSFNLIERIAGDAMNLVMEDDRVLEATVRVEKPGALRFTDNVSVVHTKKR